MAGPGHSLVDGAIRWRQDGDRVWVMAADGRWHFDMPPGFDLDATHPDLVRVASQFLLGQWVRGILKEWTPTRSSGPGIGLAFSGGGDSTAAMLLLPEKTHLVYLERSFPSGLQHANAWRFLARLRGEGRSVIRVPSDHETIRSHFSSLSPGFSIDMAVIAHVVLLADHLDLGGVATGMNLGAAYFDLGRRYRDFGASALMETLGPRMRSIGLEYLPITAGTHEALTDRIVRSAGLIDWASGCVRSSVAGETCGRCKKCFRRDAKEGVIREPDDEVRATVRERSPKSASTWLYSLQRLAEQRPLPVWARTSRLYRRHRRLDTRVLERYHSPALALIPSAFRSEVRRRLDTFTDPMPEPSPILGWDLT